MDDINSKNKLNNVMIENSDAQIQNRDQKKNTFEITQTQNTEKVKQYSSKDKSISPTFTFQNIQGSQHPTGYLITNKQFTNTSFSKLVAASNI